MSKNRINDNKPVRELKKKIGSVSMPKKKRNDKNNKDRQAEAARHDCDLRFHGCLPTGQDPRRVYETD